MSKRLRVRETDDDEGRRLMRILRPGSRSMVIWLQTQMVRLFAQSMYVDTIMKHAPRYERSAHPVASACAVVKILVAGALAADAWCELSCRDPALPVAAP